MKINNIGIPCDHNFIQEVCSERCRYRAFCDVIVSRCHEIEQRDRALGLAKEALTAIIRGPFLMHESYTSKLSDAVSAIDKALGKNS